MDKIEYVKLELPDGTYSDDIPIGVNSDYVDVDGSTLTEKINKKANYYNTVAEMKTDRSLFNGSIAVTLGYYSANDGGGATYKIVNNVSQTDFQENLINGKYANLVIENNTINIRQLGARSQDSGNNKYDIKNYLDIYEDICNKKINNCVLYIPSGIWYTSDFNITTNKGFKIVGDTNFSNTNICGTILSSYNDNQNYILKIGGLTNNKTDNYEIKDIMFSTANYIYSNGKFQVDNIKNIEYCLMLRTACFGIIDNLFFGFIKGSCLSISQCWEIYFKLLNFRNVSSYDNGIITFNPVDFSTFPSGDCSALYFGELMFEATHGHLIECKPSSDVKDTHFNLINFETNYNRVNGEVYTEYDSSTVEDINHFNIIKGGCRISIGTIQLVDFARRYWVLNDNKYSYDIMIDSDFNSDSYVGGTISGIIINNIVSFGSLKDIQIFNNEYYISRQSSLKINNIINRNEKDFFVGIKGGYDIDINTNLYGLHQSNPSNFNQLSGVFIPFYDIASRFPSNSSRFGLLYYDSESINKNKIVVKLYNDDLYRAIQLMTILNKLKIYARMKCSNNTTINLTAYNYDKATSLTFSFTNDGNYKVYEMDFSSWDIGDTFVLRLSSNNGDNVYLDCYY